MLENQEAKSAAKDSESRTASAYAIMKLEWKKWEDLGLRPRTAHALVANGIVNIASCEALGEKMLRKLPWLGPKCVADIGTVLFGGWENARASIVETCDRVGPLLPAWWQRHLDGARHPIAR